MERSGYYQNSYWSSELAVKHGFQNKHRENRL